MAFLPLSFAISIQENELAVSNLIKATLASLQCLHNFCLASQVLAIFLDGGAALLAAFHAAFPEVRIFRCLQHIKKNIMQAGQEWVCKNHGKKVKSWVHRSAFLPPPLFSLFWMGALQELRADGEDRFVGWLLDPKRGGHLAFDPAVGCISAQWRCSWADTVLPFSTYSQNAIESTWKAMDLATDDMPRRVDLLTELDFLGQLTRYWYEKGTHRDIVPEMKMGMDGSRASKKYLRGRGPMSDRDPQEDGKDGKGKQWRKLTVDSITELVQDGPMYIQEEMSGRRRHKGTPVWPLAFPKYDAKKYDADILHKLVRVMTAGELRFDDTRALGMTTDGGGVDLDRILEVARKYTVVILRDGRITESHQDAMIHGETEHSRWVEHHMGFQDHSPIAHATNKRATGRKGVRKDKRKAKAKAKAAPRAQLAGQSKSSRKRGRGGGTSRKAAAGSAEAVAGAAEGDVLPTITVTLCGAGKDNVLADLQVAPGVTARELRELAAGIVGQPESEVVLMNLDNPMFLVGDMRLQVSTRVAVRSHRHGG